MGAGEPRPVYLIHGDLVLAEPAGRRLADALAGAAGCQVVVHRRPPELSEVLSDLRTFSLFDAGKVVLCVDTAVLADRRSAADLVDTAAEVLPVSLEEGEELAPKQRQGASRLLQALRLFELDPDRGSPEAALEELPKWALQGGEAFRKNRHGRGRGKRQVEDLRAELAGLLEAARRTGLTGRGGSQLSELSEVLSEGLPEGHSLVMVERSAAADHPLVERLHKLGAVLELGKVEEERRGGWQGLELLAGELGEQTGVGITRDAMEELARRTLRQDRQKRKGSGGAVDADSTARLAGEYRKLAHVARGAGRKRIDRPLVEEAVEDRGEEDVFKLLDAVGAGRGSEALARLDRLMASAEDPVGGRLTFFALFSGFCRQLTAVRGMMEVADVPPGEGSYPRFKSRWAPRLQDDVAGEKSPVAGIHPYRLHRSYLAASRLDSARAAMLPWWVLEAELQIKGDSGEPDAALAHLVARVADLLGS